MKDAHVVEHVDVWPIDIPLCDDFVISRGSISQVESAFVAVRTRSGITGYGEIAPFEPLTGEIRDDSVVRARELGAGLMERDVADHTVIAAELAAAAPEQPAARTGLECAVVDCFARSIGKPLHRVWGARAPSIYETDITLPILGEDRIDALGDEWYRRGFRVFKLKVGANADAEISRVHRMAARYTDVSFILDANQAFDVSEAIRFVRELGSVVSRVRLLEQPVPRDDLEGMTTLRETCQITIAADEAVFTLADARRVIEARAADVINLKIMKSGLHESIEIARLAQRAGVGLMVGGMIETRLAMSFSLAIALSLGGVDHFDLDTPLLMATDPIEGGYEYEGPRMLLGVGAGVGAAPANLPDR